MALAEVRFQTSIRTEQDGENQCPVFLKAEARAWCCQDFGAWILCRFSGSTAADRFDCPKERVRAVWHKKLNSQPREENEIDTLHFANCGWLPQCLDLMMYSAHLPLMMEISVINDCGSTL